jgi:hypothetical protein|tara:strand:+ start:1109 stop:1423 length:315 start_codon:yes stop_codon:yes gene_type:complete
MSDLIKSSGFKKIRKQADVYAKSNGFPRWGARVAWFCLVYGPVSTGHIVQRRDFDKSGKALQAFTQLVLNGRISVVDDGVFYREGDDEGRTMEWFDGFIQDAMS